MKISELQSQIAMNRNIIKGLEDEKELEKQVISGYKLLLKNISNEEYANRVNYHFKSFKNIKKRLEIYAKLQKALKKEIAYKIQYNRAVKQIEATVELAKKEGWSNFIVMEEKDDQTN